MILHLIDRRGLCSVIKIILDAKDNFFGTSENNELQVFDELDADPYHHDHAVFFHFHVKQIRQLCTETNMGEMEDDTLQTWERWRMILSIM